MFDNLHTTWFDRVSNATKTSPLQDMSWQNWNLFQVTNDLADLEKAMTVWEEGWHLAGQEDKHGRVLRWGGAMWLEKGLKTQGGDAAAIGKGMQYLLQSSASDKSWPRDRIVSAAKVMHRATHDGMWELAWDIAEQIFPLLPLVTGRDSSNEDKIYTLREISAMASDVCAAVLMIKPPTEALLKLEAGRGIVMGDLINSQSDLSGLQQAHPNLAREYDMLRRQASESLKRDNQIQLIELLNERREVFQQLQLCEGRIRAKAGFETFHLPLTLSQMVDCARKGPIIVVNITYTSADAIFLLSSGIIDHLRLDSMLYRGVNKFLEHLVKREMDRMHKKAWSYDKEPGVRDLESDLPPEAGNENNFLSWLWYTCVKPILKPLAAGGHISTGDEKGRVWWIGTGLASGLPFHAAGDYSKDDLGEGESCLDYVISSYTPTIKALQSARVKAAQQASRLTKERPSLLIATMPDTPGHSTLHGVRRKAQGILDTVRQTMAIKQLVGPSTDKVLSQLQDAELVHFACHGYSDPGDPANSHLLLQKLSDCGAVVDKLTVSKLLNTQTMSGTWVAYLSACSTAEVRDRTLLDEGLDITSGFLIAGFSHVIGSLWPADDEVCVHMATYFYEALIARRAAATDPNRAVAEAVRDATLRIRRQYWQSPMSWALYTHMGA